MVLLSSPRYALLMSEVGDEYNLRVYDVAKETCVRQANLKDVSTLSAET